jgi:hypothetical protein
MLTSLVRSARRFVGGREREDGTMSRTSLRFRGRALGAVLATSLIAGVGVAGATASGASAPSDYAPKLNPKNFDGSPIDNPYMPLIRGSKWVYREGDEDVVVTVTPYTKKIMGVETVVVRDTVSKNGVPVEDTSDFFAQDRAGNVWYFGEATVEYEHGQPWRTEGSWEGGLHGGRPGIAMPAHPKVGQKYKQEYLKGVAEDRGEILGLDATADVPFGHFDRLVRTKDTTALEPDVVENKFYAKGIGVVMETIEKGGGPRSVLISFTMGDG